MWGTHGEWAYHCGIIIDIATVINADSSTVILCYHGTVLWHSAPRRRQHVEELSRRGGSPSAMSRSGSPGGSDLAEHSIRAASTPRLIWAVGKPVSAISGATGADRGQPVIALALLGARSPVAPRVRVTSP